MSDDSPLWSREEAAVYARMHPGTLGALANRGIVPSIQHTTGGRRWYTKELLDGYLADRARRIRAEHEAAEAARANAKPDPTSPWQVSA